MPGETTTYKAEYAVATDEIKTFPAEVSQPGQEKWDTVLKEHLLKIAEHGVSFTAASGELVKCTAAITVTLPAAAKDAVVGVLANNHEIKVGAGAAVIFGDFITGSTPITLLGYQHVILQSDGTNWFIIAGEPKRETGPVHKTFSKAESEAGVESSATRPAFVVIGAGETFGVSPAPTIGGELIPGATGSVSASFYALPGAKWKTGKETTALTQLL